MWNATRKTWSTASRPGFWCFPRTYASSLPIARFSITFTWSSRKLQGDPCMTCFVLSRYLTALLKLACTDHNP